MELKIEKKTAKRLFPECPKWFQDVLTENFGKDYFAKRSFEDIKSFNDACEECGTTEEEFNKKFGNLGLSDDTIAYEMLKIVVKAIVGDWVADWNNGNQRKWAPIFNLSSGFGFSVSSYGCGITTTLCGSRLCFETEAQSNHAATTFIKIYERFLTIKK